MTGTDEPRRHRTQNQCCSVRKESAVAASLALLTSVLSASYVLYEMVQADRFLKSHEQPDRDNDMTSQDGFVDKNGRFVEGRTLNFFIAMGNLEKGVCCILLGIVIGLAISSILLLRGAQQKRKRKFLPYFVCLVATFLMGTIFLLFLGSIYGFYGLNKIAIILWLLLWMIQFHFYRRMRIYYESLSNDQPQRERRHTDSLYGPPPDYSLFTVSDSVPSSPLSVVSFIVEPPKYEEISRNHSDVVPGSPSYDTCPHEDPPAYQP